MKREDRDRIFDDLAAFADVIGWPLASWQVDALRLELRETAIVAPRQSGKSRSLATLGVWWAFRAPEQRVLVVSAGEAAAVRLLAEVRRMVTGSDLLAGSVVDEQASLVRLSNGSEVRSVPASERAIRGASSDLLLIDEAAMVPEPIFDAARPTTAARPDARIVLASSATVQSGEFYDAALRGETGSEHVRTFRWSLEDCEWISPSAIAAARESMSELRFAAEYLGEFASGADALFTRPVLDRVIADYLPTPLAELRGPARVLAGVDWGATNDRSAIVAIARLSGGPFAVACAHRWPAGHPLSAVIDEIATSRAHFDTLTLETNGLGLPCAQELMRRIRERPLEAGGGSTRVPAVVLEAEEFERSRKRIREGTASRRAPRPGFATRTLGRHTTAEMKAAMYSSLRLLFDRGQLLLPASAEELIRELLLLRVDLAPSGAERIEASRGHDDLADSLALACAPYPDRENRRWRVYLRELAEAEGLEPRRSSLLPDQATVRTGGGVTVPRVPVWQSVRGGETTVPAGLDLRRLRPNPELQGLREEVRVALDGGAGGSANHDDQEVATHDG